MKHKSTQEIFTVSEQLTQNTNVNEMPVLRSIDASSKQPHSPYSSVTLSRWLYLSESWSHYSPGRGS